MRQIIIYFIALMILDIILVKQGNLNFSIITICLTIIFYFSTKKELQKYNKNI
ncbi:hypothetical protein ALC152_17300 [Arcobacter sp. 15-2]